MPAWAAPAPLAARSESASGSRDDYFELRSYGAIAVRAGDGNDYVQGRSGGTNTPVETYE